jgi:N-acetylneuraminic acid mutarotase
MKNKLLFFSKRMLILVLAFCINTNYLKGQTIKGSWTSITGVNTARWFPGTTIFDGKIYIIGGNATSSSAPLNVVEVYDPATDTWETKTPMPTPRSQVSACTFNGKIYVIGGSSGPSSWTPVSTVYIYDPATDTWSTGADMPSPRTELSLISVQNKIYAIGGIDGSSTGSKSVDIYDPIANTWSNGSNMPTARGTMPACELDGKIYVFGGSNGNASGWNHYATLEVYDIATDNWSTKQEMPASLSHLTGCVLNNKIFALGGTQVDQNMTYAAMYSYDPKTDTWESEPSMITAREAFKAVVVNGKIYAIGGTQYPGLIAFSNSEVYDTVPKVFISNPEMRLPVNQASIIGKLFVPNSGNLKFTYTRDETLYDGALFEIQNDSVIAVQNFGLNSNKEYQFEVLAISENNDSVRTVIKLSTFYKVDAVFSAPMGFLLESSDKKVMLDVLTSKTPGYGFVANSNEIYDNMKNGVDPFNNIDLIYTSHTHGCHFDAELLFNTMKNNPKAIAIMSQDVKTAMKQFFTDNPDLLNNVFAPEIPVNSFIDTTLSGIKIRLTNIAHEGSSTLSINLMLDSIQFVHFDDYNNLTVADYKTIGFTQLPTDVAFIGSLLLNGEQQMIKDTYNSSTHLTISHIAFITNTLYNECVTKAEKLKALNYQINLPRWPMEMFSYKKSDTHISLSTLNNAPKINRTFNDLTVEKDNTVKVRIPKTSFIETDPGDTINYTFSINSKPLPEWAIFDTISRNMEFTPSEAKSYTVTITATDNHLSYANTSFKLKVTEPVAIENKEINTEFKVYPNPAQSLINIESPGDKEESYSVNLYNILGEKIYSVNEIRDSKITIDLSMFSESVIFLIITSEGTNECHKITKN